MSTLNTSSGIIRNRYKPRTGIVSANSLHSFVFDEINQGIDITYEEWHSELEKEIRGEVEAEGKIDLDSQEFENEIETKLQYECDGYCNDSHTILFGNAWYKGEDGKYHIDKSKEFAATYNSDSGNIAVEFSQLTKQCNNTSPCYVMSDGSGPCGDLDQDGDAVTAFTLPSEYFLNEGEDS